VFHWFAFGRIFSIFSRPVSPFRRLKGQKSSDIDQVVRDYPQSNPLFHASVAAVPAAIQSMSSFKHTDPTLASGPPGLSFAKPSFLLKQSPFRTLCRSVGNRDALDAELCRGGLILCREKSAIGRDHAGYATELFLMNLDRLDQ
jgi:hypothetical protein